MAELAPRTFYVEKPSAPTDKLSISELHVNLWIDESTEITVDIGIKLQVSADIFRKGIDIPLRCALQLPPIPDSLRSLDPIMLDDTVARWLFNDDTKVERLGPVGTATPAGLITYRDSPFYVVPSKGIEYDGINECAVIHMHLASIKGRASPSCDKNAAATVNLYMRFQYKTRKGSSAFRYTHGAFRDHLFLDLRFNDVRGMSADVVTARSYLSIDLVRVFLIHRLSCALQLAPKAAWKQYERLLEHRGHVLTTYFASATKWRRVALIHQWILEAGHRDGGFNAVLILKAEKSAKAKILASLFLGILVYFLITLGYREPREALKAVVDGLLAFAIAALLGLAADFFIKASNNE